MGRPPKSHKLRIGEVRESANSGKFKIVDIEGVLVKIKFISTNFETQVRSSAVYNGKVKDPYYPRVFGVGYIGVGPFASNGKHYRLWAKMLERCYSKEIHKRVPAYIGCTVVKRWMNFQVFCMDIERMQNWNTPGFELDKDLRVLGNKKYGPKYCSFVPRSINNLLCGLDPNRGVRRSRKGVNSFRVTISVRGKHTHFGSYPTKKKAVEVYRKERSKYIRRMAKENKAVLHRDVYSNLRKVQL